MEVEDKTPPQPRVFMNFRGADVRQSLVVHLEMWLKRRGINVYVDSEELRGVDLTTLIHKGIQESRIAIVIFSRRYTESSWCLNELVKIKERVEEGKLMVFPIFYKLNPSEVTKLEGEFDFNLWNHVKRTSEFDKLKKWKEALDFVSHRMGFVFDDNRNEATLVDAVGNHVKTYISHLSMQQIESLNFQLSKTEKDALMDEKTDVNLEEAECVNSVSKDSRRDNDLNLRKDDNFLAKANSDATSIRHDSAENKRFDPFIDEKKQEKVIKTSEMVIYDEHPPQYQVFISFRGKDVRNTFFSHLFETLKREGINVYSDEAIVSVGGIVKVIEESRISLVIFSETYAQSRWCLDELVKINERVKEGKLLAIPIFYKVDPSVVKHLKGDFGINFWNLWRINRDHNIIKWKEALESVASMIGICLEHDSESEVTLVMESVKKVIARISLEEEESLSTEGKSTEWPTRTREQQETYVNSHLFGMEQRLEQLEKKLEFDCNETRIIGVVGMPGVGKTTLAKMLYEKWNCKFISCVSLLDIHKKSEDHGPKWLRETLLEVLLEGKLPVIRDETTHESVKTELLQTKIFAVLDDVSDKKHLEFLLSDREWIKKGSKIVITTSDRSFLKGFAHDTYVVPPLNDKEAFQLFSHLAFDDQNCRHTKTFLPQTRKFVDNFGGNPLAIQLLTCELKRTTRKDIQDGDDWKEELLRMTHSPSMKILDVWRSSIDQLNKRQKDVFLDIVCYFRSENEYYVRSLLDSGDPDSSGVVSEVRDLANKFLITISDGKVEVNYLLKMIGKDLGSHERLRLWNFTDIVKKLVKMKYQEVKDVRGIFLDMSKVAQEIPMMSTTFTNMSNLRYLKIYNSCCHRQFKADYKLYFYDGLKLPLEEVRYLHWLRYPLEEIPPDFNPINLVDLRLPYSNIVRVWNGLKDTPRLKWVDLSHSSKLRNLSALSRAENLQRLNLEGCTVLDELPRVIRNMKSLVFLNLRGCITLSYLCEMNLVSLRILILSGCVNLEEFQLISESLEVLHLDGTAIKGLPPAIKKLQKLVLLNLKNCKMLKCLPKCLGELKALEELVLSGCSRLENLSDVSASMKNLQSLLIDRMGAKEMPNISSITKSEDQASTDMFIEPIGPSKLSLCVTGVSALKRLSLSGNDFVSLQIEIGKLYNLKWLDVKLCKKLRFLPTLPPGLQYFDAHGCDSLQRVGNPLALPVLSEQIHATFNFSNCNKLDQDAKDSIISYTWWRSQLMLDELTRYNGGFVLEALIGTCFPGWDVPAWFTHQASGSLLESKLPPHWYANRFTGIALCAVVQFPGYHEQMNHFLVNCNCVFKNEYGSRIRFSYTIGNWSEPSSRAGKIDLSHIFIGYASLLDIKKHGEDEYAEGCSQTEASFEFQVTNGTKVLETCKVLKCGFSFVYAINERENVCEDAKTVVNPEKIENIPGEARSYGNSRSHENIQYEPYSGPTLGRDQNFFSEAKSDVIQNLQSIFENKRADLSNEESEVGGEIIVSSHHDKTSLAHLEKPKMHSLVGVEIRLKQMEKVLYSTPGKTIIVGVVGMPGIGKTTLATTLFEKRGCKFPSHSFLTISKECRLEQLRRVFLKDLLIHVNQDVNDETTHESMKDELLQTKVFVVLDGVSEQKQLDFLLGNLNWIKKGSKIVITTSDKSLLEGLAHDMYVVPQLNNIEAFELFTYHAFNDQICSSETFLSLSGMVVDNAGGHPLALKLLGRSLCGKSAAYWHRELSRLRQSFQKTLRDTLKYAIDQLNEQQRDIFLDIVYFFKSEDEHFVRSVLNSGNPEGASEVTDLVDKSFILIYRGRVEMHDQLCKLGNEIGSRKRHRLCNYEDIINTLIEQQETKNVRGIFLDMSEITDNIALNCMTFSRMRNLRYLKIYDSCCPRQCKSDYNLYFPEGLYFRLEEVRYLHWVKCPLKELPLDFRPANLVDLRLPYSKIERLWKGFKDTPWLKWVDLSYSSNLLDLSALSKAENLQRLNLEGCTSLNELPVEIQNMKSLVFLNLRGCIHLWYLPKMNLISLKTLILSDCSNLKEFQLISESIEFLHLDGTAIKGLSPAIQNLQRLVVLNLKNCIMLECLPSCLDKLQNLDELILSGCSRLKHLPNVKKSLMHLKILLLDGTGANAMPSISCFTESEGPASVDSSLQRSRQHFSMRKWPCSANGVSSLRRLCLSENDIVSLQPDIGQLYNLNWLDIKQCQKLTFLPTLPPRLQYFDAHGCDSLERVSNPLAFPVLSEQINATFNFSNCNKLDQDAKNSIISYTRWRSQLVLDECSLCSEVFVLETLIRTCFPGWEVPAWFSHQASGSELKQTLPSHWSDNRSSGLALCAVIQFPSYHEQRNSLFVKCNCLVNNEDGSCSRFSFTIGSWSEPSNTPGKIESSHVFIGYTSSLDIKKYSEIDEERCSHSEASFVFQVTDGTEVLKGYEVLKCGFSLVYATDELWVEYGVSGAPVEGKQYKAQSENVVISNVRRDTETAERSQGRGYKIVELQKAIDRGSVPVVSSTSQAELQRSHPVVFVSFHGDDLRTFVGHLVRKLTDTGVKVFTDNGEQKRMTKLKQLYQRIEESKIAVVIFSKTYTESFFCLNELVKIEKLMKDGNLLVIPVFYKVSLSSVQKLWGKQGRTYNTMRKRYKEEPKNLPKWVTSVKSIAKKVGIRWELYSEDALVLKETVNAVQRALCQISLETRGHPKPRGEGRPEPRGEGAIAACFIIFFMYIFIHPRAFSDAKFLLIEKWLEGFLLLVVGVVSVTRIFARRRLQQQ